MRAILVPVATAAMLCGCAAQARDPGTAPAASVAASNTSPASLDGTRWRFVEVAGKAVPPGVTATMRLDHGRASGKAGCNAYGATYHVAADGSASFRPGMSTKMACLEPDGVMQVERGIFSAFREVARMQTADGELVLLDAAGKPLAKLQPDASP